MHGIIFQELRQFVKKNLGFTAWRKLKKEAGLGTKMYLPTQTYPDEEVVALVVAATKMTGMSADEVLEKFGTFIVPDLVKIYGRVIKPEWTMLDLLENTENTMHKAVRFSDASADPPYLTCNRISKTEMEIIYDSPRKMVALARGILNGVANHFQEPMTIHETHEVRNGRDTWILNVQTS